MLRSHRLVLGTVTGLALLGTFGACSGGGDTPGGAGGRSNGNGGNAPSGGSPGGSSNGGLGNGGGVGNGGSGQGGGVTAAGGNSNSGGSVNGAGGAANGGTSSGGGAAAGASSGGSSNGGSPNAGGSVNSGGNGGAQSTGGATTAGSSSGGASAGGASSGGNAGAKSTGGASSGGASSGGAGSGGTTSAGGTGSTSCPNADPTELTLVRGWLNNTTAVGALPKYAYDNIKSTFPAGAAFDKLACSIAMSCKEFAPMETNWLRKCEAVITSAIVAESSYNPLSVVNDSYATRSVSGVTANDPTVGLLQIRFSSTVHDYNYYGPPAKMASIGCSWPSALTSQADTATWWATSGGTTYLSFMQDVSCNVGLATWYYFYNATGNGGANAVWISNYCSGQGVAGNMVVGLLSHLMGGNYPRPADANNAYPWGIECCPAGNPAVSTCTGCTGRFAAFMGIGTASSRPSPDPFLEALAPEPSKYCK
ncbi:MAG: hypothetical protein QM756_38510 [Polyangiaceae bacterium]